MKRRTLSVASIILCITMLFTLVGCNSSKVPAEGAWETAVYLTDTELGKGEKTLTMTVQADEQEIVFTVHSDAETVGEALQENKLIDGEESEFGLYVKAVNGIVADYDTDKTFWAFNKDGEMMPTGVDMTELSDGDSYELVKTKG